MWIDIDKLRSGGLLYVYKLWKLDLNKRNRSIKEFVVNNYEHKKRRLEAVII